VTIISGIAAIAALIALVVAAVWATGRNELVSTPHSPAVLPEQPIPLKRSRLAMPEGTRMKVLVLGDRYSSTSDGPPGQAWVDRLPQEMCLDIVQTSADGGYAATGAEGAPGSTGGGIPIDLDATRPQVLLVGAGTDDYAQSSQQIIANANRTFKALRNAVGAEVPIIAIGPIASPITDTTALERVATAVSYSARMFHVDFIDPVKGKWLDDPAMWTPDGLHLSDAGSADFTRRMADELEHMGAARCAPQSEPQPPG
jgi:hypothetical protein